MGSSAEAILFYGLCWTEERLHPWTGDDEDDDDDDVDWEERYALRKGLVPPAAPFPDVPYNYTTGKYVYTPAQQLIVDEYTAFWAKKREIAGTSPVECDSYGSGDCRSPFVAIKSSVLRADWGSPLEIAGLPTPTGEWNAQLREFCYLMGIEWQEPRWWLVAYYG